MNRLCLSVIRPMTLSILLILTLITTTTHANPILVEGIATNEQFSQGLFGVAAQVQGNYMHTPLTSDFSSINSDTDLQVTISAPTGKQFVVEFTAAGDLDFNINHNAHFPHDFVAVDENYTVTNFTLNNLQGDAHPIFNAGTALKPKNSQFDGVFTIPGGQNINLNAKTTLAANTSFTFTSFTFNLNIPASSQATFQGPYFHSSDFSVRGFMNFVNVQDHFGPFVRLGDISPPVPEPASISLLALGSLTLIRKRQTN
ncbi:PEP-CTERM sorting domain-containing protein [Planctomycetota bacterium]|nr:PEP-CTERM sorting domain-containing protein [Planctomycetota bacterium]